MLPVRIIEILKNRNRTVLEVHTGALLWTIPATAAGFVLPLSLWEISRWEWCFCIWMAFLLVLVSVAHMQKVLDRALDFDEGTATKLIFRGYLIRYVAVAVILTVSAVAGMLNPVVLCLGYLLIMKIAVYSQPFIHKFYNRLFHETDPVPQPLEEER